MAKTVMLLDINLCHCQGWGKGILSCFHDEGHLFQWGKQWCGDEESDGICRGFLCKSFLYLIPFFN